MSSTSFTVHTSLSPAEVMDLLTDFGPDRAKHWPNVDDAHFRVHELGPNWAVVTEGTGMAWEKLRYDWDTEAGTVTLETVDSNIWGPGSGWRYAVTPAPDGADLHVTINRNAKSLVGRAVAALIPVAGAWGLGKQFRSVLAKAERERG